MQNICLGGKNTRIDQPQQVGEDTKEKSKGHVTYHIIRGHRTVPCHGIIPQKHVNRYIQQYLVEL